MVNSERYNQIIGEVYEKYSIIASVSTQVDALTKEEFINKIKTDGEFAKKWGLKVEESELSYEERSLLYSKKMEGYVDTDDVKTDEHFDSMNIPTKSITIEYNNKRVEIYE